MRPGMTTLQERKRQATADHLMQAALRGLMQHGLDITVEEIARIGGVSRRTVFHHFATRDELLSAAALAGQAEFDNSLPHYTGDGDWRGWLSDLCCAMHLPSAAFGRGLWEMVTRQDLSQRLTATAEQIARHRRERNRAIVDTLWQALGRDDGAPDDFRVTVIAHLSPFFTLAVNRDGGGDPALAASLAQAAILAIADKYS